MEDAFDWLWQAHAHETGHRKGKGLYAYIRYNKGYQNNITRDLCNFLSMCCWRCYHAEGREWEDNCGEMTLGLGKSHPLTQTQLAELHVGFRGMWQTGPADADGNPTMVFKKLKCSTYGEDGGRIRKKKRARASVPATEAQIDNDLVCCGTKN